MTPGDGKLPACYGGDVSIAPNETAGVAAEVAEIRAAYARAVNAIGSSPDLAQAFRDASALGDLMKQMESDAAGMRAHHAARLADTRGLSVTQIGELLGMSRSRAAQLVTAGRKRRTRR